MKHLSHYATQMTTDPIGSRVDRLYAALHRFPHLPDDAHIDMRVFSSLCCRSAASLWRDLALGRIPQPVRFGPNCTRWRVGDVRAYLKGKRSDGH